MASIRIQIWDIMIKIELYNKDNGFFTELLERGTGWKKILQQRPKMNHNW
jgi:hypothetical protein